MVAVAQLVESWIVIPLVVGSSPIGHPKFQRVSSSSRQSIGLQNRGLGVRGPPGVPYQEAVVFDASIAHLKQRRRAA
jgi:hypothetical protein